MESVLSILVDSSCQPILDASLQLSVAHSAPDITLLLTRATLFLRHGMYNRGRDTVLESTRLQDTRDNTALN